MRKKLGHANIFRVPEEVKSGIGNRTTEPLNFPPKSQSPSGYGQDLKQTYVFQRTNNVKNTERGWLAG